MSCLVIEINLCRLQSAMWSFDSFCARKGGFCPVKFCGNMRSETEHRSDLETLKAMIDVCFKRFELFVSRPFMGSILLF